jgi:hypothetical protein
MVAGELAARRGEDQRPENRRNHKINMVLHSVHRAEEKDTK